MLVSLQLSWPYAINLFIAVDGGYIEQYYKTNKQYCIQFQQVVCSLVIITYKINISY